MTKRLQIRRDTAENWAKVNPVLLMGEIGFIVNNGYISSLKIGNGVSPYSMLDEYMLIKADDIEGLIKAEDVAKIYLPREEALSKIQIEALLANKIGFDEFELGKDDLIEQLQRVTLALYDDNLMALVPNDVIIMEQLAPDVREAIASGGGSSDINLTPDRIVETDDEGKLGVSKYSVDTLITAIEDMMSINDNAIREIANSNKARINAIADTDAEEYEFAEIVTADGAAGDLIYNTDIPSDKIGKGKVVFIGSENISSTGTIYKDHFAYQVQGGITTSDYTYYMLFSNDNYGNAYTSYQFNANIPKYFRNTEDGKLYTWSGGTMVVTEGTMSGVGMQLGSISESKLDDDASAKLNAGGMLPFEAMLTSLQIDNISVIDVSYIQAATDTSPMHVYYYQNGSNSGFFVAMSELSVEDANYGTAPAYTRFVGSEMYNDYSGLESGSLSYPVAREDQMYLIKGSNGGVYRYIGNVKSLVKLF